MLLDTARDKDVETPEPSAVAVSSGSRVGTLIRRAVGTVLLVGVVAVAGLVGTSLFTGKWMASTVLSGSMRPRLPVGGLVIAQRVPVNSLAVGDIIIFQRPDKPSEQMVHRIIKITRGSAGQVEVKTKGDANQDPDPWTATIQQSTIYRVRGSVPLAGYVVVAFQNHRGDVLIGAGVVALLVGVSSVWEKGRKDAASSEDPATCPGS